MRFDAYQASIGDRNFVEVAEHLAWRSKAIVCKAKPRARMPDMVELSGPFEGSCFVGRDYVNDLVFVEAKGRMAVPVSESLRVLYPEHRASRLDVCEDYRGGRPTFNTLRRTVLRVKGAKTWSGWDMKSDDAGDGRTWLCGTKGSAFFSRLYEKGLHPQARQLGYPEDSIRVEAQCRPPSQLKAAAARLSPSEVWGMSGWGSRAFEALTGCQVPRLAIDRERPTFDSTTLYLGRQFARFWDDCRAQGMDLGDWGVVVDRLREADAEATRPLPSWRNPS